MSVNPADSPVLGALYGTDAMRAVMGEMAFLQRMLDVEAALARAQAKLGIVPADAAAAITQAADARKLDLPALAAATRNTGYPVVGLVKQLSALAGTEAGRWTHWGATTQDIMDSAVVLQIRDGLALVEAELDAVIAGFAAMARAHRDTVMAGRTHLQHALPTTFGCKVAVWLSPLITTRERFAQLRPRVLKLEFGGAAGTLASLGEQGLAVQAGLAAELGLAVPDVPWHVARDGVAEAVSLLGLLCGALSKIATDVILLMQNEVAEVAEPHQFGRGGSSTMPQKRNPISCEYIIAQSRGVHALVPQMLGAMAQDHERGTGPWQAEALAIGQSFLLAHGALACTRVLAEGLVVDAARMQRNLDSTGGLIMGEAVMMGLAPVLGRGEAHHVVNRACDLAIAEGISLAEALGRETALKGKLDATALAKLTAPERYLGAAGDFVDRVLGRLAVPRPS
ncbi:3-carboxy-cis,cis-muconate cycloisomerase [Siccirubricoccus sp. KC 17139]|uniref:3-carboxy-cis,cis-muconate cycloisomerase n=1 Tax=Siccirubricoccus soli TaxID=2899147 RepID=A0ABT1D1Y2_9PROT|nr:3-carboxy-cis,cis-muconate cycloisomerase [Siccirubricoccus soli]MCO6415926.1 3-carboxy-cis,cis-muconate cycloisomerase [Siccirubricoccus soli]MCP2682058.1 3-carboxy-cis,cis-muconate cycloisomerase [Siccirubricoccus soli]